MASGELYEVERIVDKRKNKKGKWEYLIRWKGYGSKEDTWEPEHHLLHCEEFIDQFNNLRLHDRRSKPAKTSTHAKVRDASRYQGETRKKKRTSGGGAPGPGVPHRPRKMSGGKASGDRLSKPVTYKRVNAGLQFVPPIRRPTNGLQNGETDAMHYRTAARTQSIPSSRVERMMGEMEMGGAKAPLRDELDRCLNVIRFSQKSRRSKEPSQGPDGATNSERYQRILKENVRISVHELNLKSKWVVQEDNESKQTSRSTKERLTENKGNVLERPSQSPDLNPVEMLWKNQFK